MIYFLPPHFINCPNMNAYTIAEETSQFTSNLERKEYVRGMVEKLADITGRCVEEQKIPINEKHGDVNFILSSNHPTPLIISAHYDAFIISGNTTTPGANDNGSGVGALFQAACKLFDLPVDFVFFGGEEIGCKGAKEYLSQNKKQIRGVVNLDTCGSGGTLGLLIPTVVQVGFRELMKTDDILNQSFIDSALATGLPIYRDDPLATGDHCPFLKMGIPATTIQGEDWNYFGIVDGKYVTEKMIMHSPLDTIDWVDNEFLNNVVEILVEGIKSLIFES